MEMEVSTTSDFNYLRSYRVFSQMNDACDLNPYLSLTKANALPSELLGLTNSILKITVF